MMFSAFKIKIAGTGLLVLALFGCQKSGTPETGKTYPTPYVIEVPRGFPPPVLSATNPLTVEGIELGRRLYGDSILSSNGKSCTTCHIPENSFSSGSFTFQSGLTRSVMAHINLGFKNQYNWDGSHGFLDSLAMGDFEPEIFNTREADLFSKISKHPIYPDLFQKAFGIKDIYTLSYHDLKMKISQAIAQFLRSKVSANSKFDKFRNKEATLTNMEYEGYVIFFSEKGDCFHCHAEPLLTDNLYHNNGISETYSGFDLGKELLSGKESDRGKFFTPTLRNIALTAPYMHDGRFKTLQEVIDFYDSGVHGNLYVDPLMTKTNGSRQLNLTPLQKAQLLAFLNTFTDLEYTNY